MATMMYDKLSTPFLQNRLSEWEAELKKPENKKKEALILALMAPIKRVLRERAAAAEPVFETLENS